MFNLSEYKEYPDRLSDLLPWACMIEDGVILNKDGSFQRSFKYRGVDIDSSTDESLVYINAKINNALKRLGSNWAIFVEAIRLPAKECEISEFPDAASRLLDLERVKFFQQQGNNFESEYYITFVYLPPEEKYLKASSHMVSNSHEKKEVKYNKYLTQFISDTDDIYNMLSDSFMFISPLNSQETLTYLHFTISFKYHKILMPEVPIYLDAILSDETLYGGLEPKLGEKHFRSLSITSFPAHTTPIILEKINKLPFEYRWSSRYIALDKLDAQKELESYRKKWFSKRKSMLTLLKETIFNSESVNIDNDAILKSEDTNNAIEELSEDLVNFGYYTTTITVWDEDPNIANDRLKQIQTIINNIGFVTKKEDINAVQAWLSSLPGHVYSNVRRPLINSINLGHLIPTSAVWAGPKKNEHLNDSALFYALTSGNTPFRFINHVGDVGHTMILGPTGAGKSVLLNFMALQFRRYKDAQIYIFDKGGSSLISTYAVSGDYYNLANDNNLSFQPLKNIDDKLELNWAFEWIQILFEQENIQMNAQYKKQIWDSLNNLSSIEKEQRTISALQDLLQDRTLRQALEPYTIKGPYGTLLDSTNDSLDYGNWQAFEMEQLMEQKNAILPVLLYLFHRIEQRLDGSPTMIILDEAWLFLDNDLFTQKIRQWLKTLRKSNCSVIFATQSLADASNSNISYVLQESCPVRIFLPNEKAQEEEQVKFYKLFGLNYKQINLISTAQKKRHYYYQSVMGNRLFELGLQDIALALCASSTKKEQIMAKKLFDKVGKDAFLVQYLKSKNMNWCLEWL